MKTRFEVEVTEADCKEGVRNNSHYCVVQTAMGRLIPEATHWQCDAQTIRFTLVEGGIRSRWVYLSPSKVRDYVIGFDAGDDPKPFAFVVDKPVVTTIPTKKPGTAKTRSFKAASAGTGERRSLRVFGERSFRANQLAS